MTLEEYEKEIDFMLKATDPTRIAAAGGGALLVLAPKTTDVIFLPSQEPPQALINRLRTPRQKKPRRKKRWLCMTKLTL